MNRGWYILILCLFIGINGSKAQEALTKDTFRIVKAYKPILIDADKIEKKPTIDDTWKPEVKVNYDFINKRLPVSFTTEPIKAARIKGEPLIKLYNGYVKAGVGNALVPFGEAYYNNLRSKEYSIGAHARFQNMREVNNIKGSDMQDLYASVFGKRFWKANTLSSRMSFYQRSFNYYGFYDLPRQELASKAEEDNIDQRYTRFSALVNMQSTKQDSFNLRHSVSMQYAMQTNKSNEAENNFKVFGQLSQFKNQELYLVDAVIDFNKYDPQDANTIIAVKPQISTIGERFRVKAGLGIFVNSGEETDFHFYPLAEVKYNVIEDVLIPYAGVKGEIRRNNYLSLTTENPFVDEGIFLANSNEKINAYMGLRGTLSSSISFNASGAFVETEGAHFFVQGTDFLRDLTPEYFVSYDNLSELRIRGELVYRLGDKLQLSALGEYFQFDTDNEEKAWHRPELKISTAARYDLQEKLIMKAELFYWGEQYARNVSITQTNAIPESTTRVVTLDPIIDINLGFEYRYTKRLSAFIDFNNIAGINYERYQNYLTQGFNVWGGLTYAF